MKPTITLIVDDIKFSFDDRGYTDDRLKKYIITMIKKNHKAWLSNFETAHLRVCPCGNTHVIDDYKDSLKLIKTDEFQYTLDISELKHYRDKPYGNFYGCRLKGCYLKSLNPNSLKFMMGAYKLSEADARSLILSRNKSPFYAYNHESKESYSKFQGHSNRTAERQEEITNKWKDTYYANKAEFIAKFGLDAWTIKESYNRNIYNAEKFPEDIIARRKLKTSPKKRIFSNGNINFTWIIANYSKYINDEIEFKKHCLGLIGKNRSIVGFCMLIHEAEMAFSSMDFSGLSKHGSRLLALKCTFGIKDLYDYFEVDPEYRNAYKNHMTKDSFSYSTTIDGHFFRSALESSFYLEIKKIPNVVVIDTNKKYPGKDRKFYDMRISYKGTEYILELCSFNSKDDNETYCENVESKAEIYNSVLIYNRPKFLADLINGNEITNEYY